METFPTTASTGIYGLRGMFMRMQLPHTKRGDKMLSLKTLIGTTIFAQDGSAGKITDVLFDSTTWQVTGLVLERGGWFDKERTVTSPASLLPISGPDSGLFSTLNKAEIWRRNAEGRCEPHDSDSHGCGCKRLFGYRLMAAAESGLGTVKDFTVDETNWRIKFLLVSRRTFRGYKLMICANRALLLEPGRRSARLGFPVVAS